jgi:ABC-type sugar transport system ATPase subunit
MLQLREISKSFPGVQALTRVDFSVVAGEIHALVGENGAGKSTLTKIIAGAYQPDAGQIELDGGPVRWASPAEAKRRGVHVIYQELVLFPNLSVAENVFLGNERRNAFGALDHRRTAIEARDILGRLGAHIDPGALVGELSVADQQMVEIARALVSNVKLLILDEPTAVISGREVELLFERLRSLRSAGVAVVYISHRLDEVFELSDRVTVLKDGMFVGTYRTGEITRERLVSLMVGRDLAHLFPPKRPPAAARPSVLRTERLSVAGRVADATLELRAGEIVALAGMVGSGRSELAFGIFGALPITSGSVIIDGVAHSWMVPAKAIALGVGLVTEDRKEQGLAMLMNVAANITAPALTEFARRGLIDRRAERSAAEEAIRTFHIACRGPDTRVDTMSGGNQQKVVVARWARTGRRVLILDEPTRGVDVGAKLDIYHMIQDLAGAGLAVLMISSELPEVVGLADRVIVMREGRITGELAGDQISEEAIMGLATRPTSEAA